MKKLSIYEVYVLMQDQAQCDRMRQLCIDNGLPVSRNSSGFELIGLHNTFRYSKICRYFMVLSEMYNFTKITEQEFIELLKNKEK